MRHIYEIFAHERQIPRNRRALAAPRRLSNLNENFVPLFQLRMYAVAPAAVVRIKARRAFVEGQIAVLFHSASNESRLHSADDVLNSAFVNIADFVAERFAFDRHVRKNAVLCAHNDLLAAKAIEKPFFLHSLGPLSRNSFIPLLFNQH